MTGPATFTFSSGTEAEAYERLLVPRIFAVWAEALLDALDIGAGEALLDVACGPGTVAKAAAARVGNPGVVVGTDVSAEMLDVAWATTPASARIRYELARAEDLPFGDESFDAITCQQGLQFFENRPRALVEMHRVLRPGGRVALSTWTSIEEAPFFATVRRAIESEMGDAAESMAKPFSLPDGAAIVAALRTAGFDALVGALELPLEFEGIEQAVEAMRATPVWPMVAAQPASVRTAIMEFARVEFSRYLHHGRVRTMMRSNIAIARKP